MSQLFPSFEGRRQASPYLHIRPRPRRTGLKLFAAFVVGSVCTVALIRHQGLIVDKVTASSPPKVAASVTPAAPAPAPAPVASAPAKRGAPAAETTAKAEPTPAPAASTTPPPMTPRASRVVAGERPAIASMPIGAPSASIEQPAAPSAPAKVASEPERPAPAAKTAATTPAPNDAQAAATAEETQPQPQAKPEPRPRTAKRYRNRDRGDDAIETLVRVPGRITADGRPVYRRLRDSDDSHYVVGPNNEITAIGGAGRYAGYGSYSYGPRW